MANHKSALKRARQSEIKRLRNKTVKTRIKNVVANVRQAVDQKSADLALTSLDEAKAAIDKGAKKGVIHKKTAARKISRLSKLVNDTL